MIDVAPINELSISLSLLSLRSRSLLLRLEGDERSQSLNNPLPCRLVIGQYLSSSGEVISHLNISSLHSSDGGLYKCGASNTVGKAEHQARVNVYGEFSYPTLLPTGILIFLSFNSNRDLTGYKLL